MLFGVLSFHSLLAGIAAGVSPNVFGAAFIAIVAHKIVAALALGSRLVKVHQGQPPTELGLRTYVYWGGSFTLITPVGILIGAAIMSDLGGVGLGVLLGFASGIFIFIGVDIAAKELAKPLDHLSKVAAFALGFSIMAMLALWV